MYTEEEGESWEVEIFIRRLLIVRESRKRQFFFGFWQYKFKRGWDIGEGKRLRVLVNFG